VDPDVNYQAVTSFLSDLSGLFKMAAARHTGANCGLQKEVPTDHLRKIPLSSSIEPSLETLIRKLLAKACSRRGASADVNHFRQGQVIIDAKVDGVRCLLTWLERYPPAQISFSPREFEIARMVAKGYPNKAIASVLEISSWTVCTHLRRMFAKLGVCSRAAMVARMKDAGALPSEDNT
jgi:DNA-binding NarL/FixJ family response regulator